MGDKTYASGGVFANEFIASEAAFAEALRDLTQTVCDLPVTEDERKVVKRVKEVSMLLLGFFKSFFQYCFVL